MNFYFAAEMFMFAREFLITPGYLLVQTFISD